MVIDAVQRQLVAPCVGAILVIAVEPSDADKSGLLVKLDRRRIVGTYLQPQGQTRVFACCGNAGIKQRTTYATATQFGLDGQRIQPCQLAAPAEEQHAGTEQLLRIDGDQHPGAGAVQMSTVLAPAQAIRGKTSLLEQQQRVKIVGAGTAHAKLAADHVRG